MINDENFIVIHGFMINRLKLSGTDLFVYAIIYGFTQDGESEFKFSSNYICEWIGKTRPVVYNSLKSLTQRGLIFKNEYFINNVKFCSYRANIEKITGYKEILHPIKNIEEGSKKTLPPVKNIDINNINNNNINNNNINNGEEEKKKKHKYGCDNNVLLTDNELEKLKEKFGEEYKEKIDELSQGLSLYGYKYKSHYRAILKWNENKPAKKENSVNSSNASYDLEKYEQTSIFD